MAKMQHMSPHLLENDLGRQLLRLYDDAMVEMDRLNMLSLCSIEGMNGWRYKLREEGRDG